MSWNTTIKANITKMLCRMVADWLAINTPSPDMTRLNRMVAR